MEKKTLQVVNGLGLETISGWEDLKPANQKGLRECAGGIVEEMFAQGFSQVREAIWVYKAKTFCIAGENQLDDFLEKLYVNCVRTGYNRLELYQKLSKYSEEQKAFLATRGLALMPYRNTPFGDFLEAAKGLPVPKQSDEDTMSKFVKRVGERVKELRIERRQKAGKFINKQAATKTALNAVLNIYRRIKFRNAEERQEWLVELSGMVITDMELEVEKVTVSPLPIPPGYKAQVGRPRNPPITLEAGK